MKTSGNTRLPELLTGNKRKMVECLAELLVGVDQAKWEKELDKFIEGKTCWPEQSSLPPATSSSEPTTSV